MRKLLLALVLGLAALSASAGNFKERQGSWQLGGNIGVTDDPTLFGVTALVNYYITDSISVGPLFQYGFRDADYYYGLSGQVRYSAILPGNNIIRPYGQVGIGFIEFDIHDLFHGKSTSTFLFPVGGGAEFKLADKLTLDANVLFNLSREIFIGLYVGVAYIF
jgi:hypothetical protein